MADLLENINQIDYALRTRYSEMTYISHQLENLQQKKDEISNEYVNLSSQKRTLGQEQYKDMELRRQLLVAGRESKDADLAAFAIELDKSGVAAKDDLSDDAINFFVTMENKTRGVRNTNVVGRMFDWIGKIAFGTEGEVYNDN